MTQRLGPIGLLAAILILTTACTRPPANDTALSADGTSIRFTSRGTAEPALIFVHGWSGNQSSWRYQVEVFSPEHTVVTLDLAGFGASGSGRENWTVSRFAEDVVAVVEELEIKKAILIGHSMGSGVVVEAGLMMPDRVVGVIPVDVFQNVEERLTREQITQRAERVMENISQPDRDALASAFNNRLDPAVLDEIITYYRSSPKIGWGEALREYLVWRSDELTGALGLLEVPIICINSGSRPTDIETARRYAPTFDVKVIDGVNHAIMLEAPDRFNATLQQILEEYRWTSGPPAEIEAN